MNRYVRVYVQAATQLWIVFVLPTTEEGLTGTNIIVVRNKKSYNFISMIFSSFAFVHKFVIPTG